MMFDRRLVLAAGAASLAAAALPPRHDRFVRRRGASLFREGRRYRYAGANMWYAAYLGAAAPIGDADRLRRELDALATMGIGNVRLLASAELSPLTNSLRPAFRDAGSTYNETLLRGLDVALAELGKRGMTAARRRDGARLSYFTGASNGTAGRSSPL